MSKTGGFLPTIALAILLLGCAGPKPYLNWIANGQPVVTVEKIKADPQAFVEANKGKRVLVEGYFGVSQLAHECDFSLRDGDRLVELDLPLSKRVFESSVFKWIVVDAIVEAPRTRKLGGGDLYIISSAEDQAAILTSARLIAVDDGRTCKSAKPS